MMRPALRVGEHVGQVAQVIAHECDVGGFDGDVGAHGAHGDADGRAGQGGGVVDAVADHRGRLVRAGAARRR